MANYFIVKLSCNSFSKDPLNLPKEKYSMIYSRAYRPICALIEGLLYKRINALAANDMSGSAHFVTYEYVR